MIKLNKHEKQWLAWFLTTIGVFAVLETRAVRSGRYDATLTYATRHVLGLDPPSRMRYAGVAAFAGTATWVTAHIVTGRYVPPFLQIAVTKEVGIPTNASADQAN